MKPFMERYRMQLLCLEDTVTLEASLGGSADYWRLKEMQSSASWPHVPLPQALPSRKRRGMI